MLKAQNTKYYKRKIQNIISAKYKTLQAQNKNEIITTGKIQHVDTCSHNRCRKEKLYFATLAENENYFAV